MTVEPAAHLTLISCSAKQTQRIGELLAQWLLPGDVVCLQGDLGSGKTCFSQGIARGLGVKPAVTSPTFIIINEYGLSGPARKLRHIDLYRVESVGEARNLGLEDYLYGDSICVIEWAERALEILPSERLWTMLRYQSDTVRELAFDGQGEHYRELVQRLRQSTDHI
jgi:tRNA threonylcarbamoyladenosine biosynthesis protein TsaE